MLDSIMSDWEREECNYCLEITAEGMTICVCVCIHI